MFWSRKHKWTDWNIKERGKLVDKWKHDHAEGAYLIQERYCMKCGKTQLNSIRTNNQSNLVMIPETIKNLPKHDKVGS